MTDIITRTKALITVLNEMVAPKTYLPSLLAAIIERRDRPVGEIEAFLEGRFPDEDRPTCKQLFDLKTAAILRMR
jgi:hypothetical protein